MERKEDFIFLKEIVNSLNLQIHELRFEIIKLNSELQDLKSKISFKKQEKTGEINDFSIPTHQHIIPTHQHIIPTHDIIPTHNWSLEGLKIQNIPISTGNRGVPTDRQTDRQTHRHIDFQLKKPKNPLYEASNILDSLDNLKKEVRIKFKRLTEKEILVFSTIYQIEEEIGSCDYKSLSEKLNLTESSVRDYVGRLIKKDIPVEKIRINNKTINLHVSESLKKIASLSSILKLREV